MGLKAIKSTAGAAATPVTPVTPTPDAAAQAAAQAAAEAAQAAAAQAAAAQAAQAAAQAAQPAANVPAVQQTAVSVPASELANLNDGILEGIDDLGNSGNYVTVDGTEFLYKASNETAPYIDLVVTYGKRFYQWVDESDPQAKKFHNSDTKLDNNYKLKFEVKWFEEGADGENVEYTQTLSTTSSMNFIDYIKALAQKGLGVGNVVTRMTISRQVSKDGKNRYSRVEMEAFDLASYQAGTLLPLGVKTKEAKQVEQQ